jgi:hypothetical protein
MQDSTLPVRALALQMELAWSAYLDRLGTELLA